MGKKKKLLSVKPEKFSLRKKLEIKKQEEKIPIKSDIDSLFDLTKPIYYSVDSKLLTNNDNIILFLIEEQFLFENGIQNSIETFKLNELDIQLQYDRSKELIPNLYNENMYFEDIGYIDLKVYSWFKKHYKDCVFFKVSNWFSKEVNTLLIVLSDMFGKPVAILKTYD